MLSSGLILFASSRSVNAASSCSRSQGRQRAWAAATKGESSLEFDIFAGKKDLDDRWKRFSPTQHPIAGWVTALALLLYTETSAIAQGTDQQREACTPDAFREIADRLDGKPKQEAEVTLRNAVAAELSDDDLAAIAAGASLAHDKPAEDPKPGKSELN
jgi:hypothetical protein